MITHIVRLGVLVISFLITLGLLGLNVEMSKDDALYIPKYVSFAFSLAIVLLLLVIFASFVVAILYPHGIQ